MEKYIYVSWPDSQKVMDHLRFEEDCFYAIPIGQTLEDTTGGAYLVPEDLYNEMYNS